VGSGAQSTAKQQGTIKVVICELPVASPWLNNIEPCWKHAKKAIVEPDRKLTAAETTSRVCEHFACDLLPYLQAHDASAGTASAPLLPVPCAPMIEAVQDVAPAGNPG
jgi:hypothetical protein